MYYFKTEWKYYFNVICKVPSEKVFLRSGFMTRNIIFDDY